MDALFFIKITHFEKEALWDDYQKSESILSYDESIKSSNSEDYEERNEYMKHYKLTFLNKSSNSSAFKSTS